MTVSLSEFLTAQEEGPAGGAAKLRRELGEVMRREEFRNIRPADPGLRIDVREPPFLDRLSAFFRWVEEALRDVLDWLFPDPEPITGPGSGGGAFSGSGGVVATWIIVAVVVAVVALFVWRYLRTRRAAPPSPRAAAPIGRAEEPQEDALVRTTDEWLGEAEALARAGDFRRGIRAVYLSLLVALHRSGAIRYDRNHTNWDYVRGLRAPDPARGVFRGLTGLFDRVWYGDKPVGPGDMDRARTEAGAVRDSTARGTRP